MKLPTKKLVEELKFVKAGCGQSGDFVSMYVKDNVLHIHPQIVHSNISQIQVESPDCCGRGPIAPMIAYLTNLGLREVELTLNENVSLSHDNGHLVMPLSLQIDSRWDGPKWDGMPVTLSIPVLQAAIEAAGVCAIKGFSYNIPGSLLEAKDDVLRMVATDGSSMALVDIEWTPEGKVHAAMAGETVSLILAEPTLVAIRDICRGVDGEVSLIGCTNGVVLATEWRQTLLPAASLTGKFVPYEKLLSQESNIEVEANRQALLDHLSTLVLEDQPAATFIVTTDKVNITCGETKTELSATTKGVLAMKMSHKKLKGILSVLESERVLLQTAGAEKPVTITGVGTSKSKYLLMQMR